jgi:hypothetical protein
MKLPASLFGLCLVAATSLAMASTPSTQAYLSARDKAIATIAPLYQQSGSIDAADKQATHLLGDLQAMLRDMVGPVGIKGFPAQGAINLEALSNEVGFGKLDGLAATSLDGKTILVITTKPLLQAWLTAHQRWSGSALDNPPVDIARAIRNENFYTQAIGDDAAVYKFAELPIAAKTSNTMASAILFAYGQDEVAPNPPDMLAVTVVQDDRVFIFTQGANVDQIAACKTAFANDPSTEHVFEHCFEQHLPAQSGYASLIRQAQVLVDSALKAQQ